MAKATIIITREQGLERELRATQRELAELTAYAAMVVRLGGIVIRENRLLKAPIPRHRALVLYTEHP